MTYKSSGVTGLKSGGVVWRLLIVVLWCCLVAVFGEGRDRSACAKRQKSFTKTISIPVSDCRTTRFRQRGSQIRPRLPPFAPPTLSARRLERQTADDIKNTFPGLFFTRKEVEKLNKLGKPTTQMKNRPRTTDNSDGDLHCPTYRYFEQAPNQTESVSKERRTIVHMHDEQVYQFIHKGSCVKLGQQSGSRCSGGSCFQEKSVVYLLVFDDNNPSWPVTFDAFEVDTYCSCRRIPG